MRDIYSCKPNGDYDLGCQTAAAPARNAYQSGKRDSTACASARSFCVFLRR